MGFLSAIKKIAHVVQPFVAMVPGVGPLIAKGIDIATKALDQLSALRKGTTGETIEKRDAQTSQVSAPAHAVKQEVKQPAPAAPVQPKGKLTRQQRLELMLTGSVSPVQKPAAHAPTHGHAHTHTHTQAHKHH